MSIIYYREIRTKTGRTYHVAKLHRTSFPTLKELRKAFPGHTIKPLKSYPKTSKQNDQ